MLNRISHFFSARRKKSSTKRHSDSDSVPSPPLSPRSLQSEEEDELKTPTPSRKDSSIALPHSANTTTEPEQLETISQSSGESTSSIVSLVRCNDEDSRNVTPQRLDLAVTPRADPDSEQGSEARVQNKCLQSSVDQSSTEGSKDDKTVNQEALPESKIPLSEIGATQTVPKSHRSSDASVSNNSWNAGENQDTLNQRGTVSPSSALDLTPQAIKKCPDTQREDVGDNNRDFSPSCEQEQTPATTCPFCPHRLTKAIQVETNPGEKETEKEKEDNVEAMTKGCQAGLQPDMLLVLALPAAVIPEDSDAQNTTDTPPNTLSAVECLQQAGTSQDSKTSSSKRNGPRTSNESRPSTRQEKHTSGGVCVTRKTVNLPSKRKVLLQRESGGHLAGQKANTQDNGEVPLKITEAAHLQE